MRILIAVLSLALLFFANLSDAAEKAIGSVKIVKGTASIVRNEKDLPAKIGEALFESDVLKTEKDGAMGVIFRDNSVLSIGPNSRLQINKFAFKPVEKKLQMVVNMLRGTVLYITGVIAKLNPGAVRFETPNGAIGVRGTHFGIREKGEVKE